MSQAKVIFDVIAERNAQDAKWGAQHHGPDGWLAILVEEIGEVAKAILEGRGFGYRDELIQVAAVAIAAIESCDQGNLELGSLAKLQLEVRTLRAGIVAAGLIEQAAAEVTPGDVDYILDYCPHVPTSIQELLARAIDRKPGIPPAKPEAT